MSSAEAQLERLQAFADFRFAEFDRPSDYVVPPPPDPDEDRRLVESDRRRRRPDRQHRRRRGSPARSWTPAPNLRFIGELEGDRFASRIDVEAAWERGIKTVDTTNGSSYGVAEWALALTMIGLRNAGEQFRDIIERKPAFHSVPWDERAFKPDELTGRTVGLIGCGIIGRRLLELLEPFHTTTYVYDPYVPRELADVYDVTFTSLDNVLSLLRRGRLPGADHAGDQGHARCARVRPHAGRRRVRQRLARRDRPDRRAHRQAARRARSSPPWTSSIPSRSPSTRRSATCATSS